MAHDEVEVVACTSLILASLGAATAISYGRKRKQKHKTPVNACIRNRDKYGTFNALLPELCADGKYFQYLRIVWSCTHWLSQRSSKSWQPDRSVTTCRDRSIRLPTRQKPKTAAN